MAALLILAVSCGKKFEIVLSPTDYEFDPQGGELTVEVTTEGDWNIDQCPEWVTASVNSGSKNASIVLTAQPNVNVELREGVVEFSTSTHSAQLKLVQGYVEESFMSISPASIAADYQGGEFELQVVSNCEWNLSDASQQISWISVNPISGEGSQIVKVSIARYADEGDTSSRQATLIFAAGQSLVPVDVTQTDGSEVAVTVNPNFLRFTVEGGAQQIDVTCASNWTVSSSVPWLSVSETEGSGNAQITVTVEPNELYQSRLGAVVFVSDAQQNTTVMVSQDAAIDPHHLDVSTLNVNFGKQGGSAEITIGCDEIWKIDCPDHWVSLSVPDGNGDGSFEITAEENILNTARNTVVYVVSGCLEKQIHVHQEAGDEAPYVSLNVDVINADAVGDVFPVEVSSNVAWTVRGSSWAEPIQNSGEGDGTFSLRVDANYDMTPRSCTVRVSTAQGASASFEVVQSGYVYTLSTEVTEITAPAEGLKTEIRVFANQNWIVSKGAPWILYDPVSGTNDGAFTIVVDPNASPRDRSAEIYVTGEKDGLVIIQVNQPHAK